MKFNKSVFFIGIFFLVIIISNIYINKQLERKDKEQAYSLKKNIVTVAPVKENNEEVDVRSDEYQRKLREEMSAKYGIVITPDAQKPASAQEWEENLRNNFAQYNVLEGENAEKALKVMETNPQDYDKQMNHIDQSIAVVSEQLKQDPFNPQIAEQLENQYKLKAVGVILKEKVVSPDAPAMATEIMPEIK